MALLNMPSVSLALIDQDRIALARAYGAGTTPETLLSGGVAVEIRGGGRRDAPGRCQATRLDEDVDTRLTSWNVPANDFDKDHPVTLRGLLSMTAGIGVPGFLGYAARRAASRPSPKSSTACRRPIPLRSRSSPCRERLSLFGRRLRDCRSAYGRRRPRALPRGHGRSRARACRHDAQHLRAAAARRPRGRGRDGPFRRRQGAARAAGMSSPSTPRPDFGRRRPTSPISCILFGRAWRGRKPPLSCARNRARDADAAEWRSLRARRRIAGEGATRSSS